MGFSCTDAALRTLRAVKEMFGSDLGASNEVRLGGKLAFFERGEEMPSGGIKGDVFLVNGVRWGFFEIDADGTISRFPGISKRSCVAVHALARSPLFRSTVAVI